MIERILLFIMIIVGFWGIVTKHNIIKKIFALNIINNAVVILFVLEGSRIGSNAPIMESGITHIVDPVPQALMPYRHSNWSMHQCLALSLLLGSTRSLELLM